MSQFNRIIRAGAIMLMLVGLIGYFALPAPRNDVLTFNATPYRGEPASSPATAPSRAAITLTDGDIITPIDMAAFQHIIDASHLQAQFIMFYASWCPHCKRLYTELNTMQPDYNNVNIVTVSIDNKTAATKQFISGFSPLRLDNYIMKDSPSFRKIGDALRARDLDFTGGLGQSMGVPHLVVFYSGDVVGNIAGAPPTENLQKIIADINEYVKRTSNN